MNDAATLGLAGITWPSPAWLFGGLVFSTIGLGAFRYGRRRSRPRVVWIGVALMLYPYVVTRTWALYAVGAALCVALWLDARG